MPAFTPPVPPPVGARLRAVLAHALVLGGVTVAGLWPLVTGLLVLSSYDAGETCQMRRGGTGSGEFIGTVRYDFFPPRMLCSAVRDSGTGPDAWYTATPPLVTAAFSLVLVLAVAAMALGVFLGVSGGLRSIPDSPFAAAHRWVRLCGLLAIASFVSPIWMLYMEAGMYYGGSGAPEPYTQISVYAVQLAVAATPPLLAITAGLVGAVLRGRGRPRGTWAASVPWVGLTAGVALLALTLVLGLGSLAGLVRTGEQAALWRDRPAPASIEPTEPLPVPNAEPPSTALSAGELDEQFAVFALQTVNRIGPAYTAPAQQGERPGPELDLAVAAAPVAHDCAGGAGVGYAVNLTFSGADTDDWDVNFDAAAAAFLAVTAGWADDGYPSQTYNSEFLVYDEAPSIVAELSARHVGSMVRVGLRSLCVAT